MSRGRSRRGPVALAAALLVCLGYGVAREDPGASHREGSDAGTAEWLEAIGEKIEREEYNFTSSGDGRWLAPNRAQNLRARFGNLGLEVTSRSAASQESPAPRESAAPQLEDSGWRLELGLTGYGREGSLAAVDQAPAQVTENRVEYRRGLLTEWYSNTEKGLEQGFTVEAPPAQGDAALPLVLEMTLSGDLGAYPTEDGESVLFRTGSGTAVLFYGGLAVVDARGAPVAARLAVLPGRLQIRIDDRGAAYPLVVDPLMTSPVWTAESNQAGANLGFTVATAGDVNGDGFSDLLVGAHQYDNDLVDEGRAFLYLGSPSGPATSPSWMAEGDQDGAKFGVSVAAAGDVDGDGFGDVLVGSHLYDNPEIDEGRAFLYRGSASGLSASPAWTAEGSQAGAQFGRSLGTAGDVNGDGFSDVIVGAYLANNGQSDEGRAYVYLGSASGLSLSAATVLESNQVAAFFGFSVSTAGDVNGDGYGDIIVGAYRANNGQTDEGRAFIYMGSATGLATSAARILESNQADAFFGYSVSTAGDVDGDGYGDVIVGAHLFDNGQTDEGRSSVYLGSASGLSATAAWIEESDQAGAQFGASVAAAGDVNGDGFADVIVGADEYGNGQTGEGRAFVYLGSATGLATSPVWTDEGDQTAANFGRSVATAGDVNGDGFSDVLVGAYLYNNPETDEGRAFVYLGSAAGLSTTAASTREGNQATGRFGYSVAGAGDVNGDGYSDVVVGAYLYDNGQTDEGRAFVFLGSASGLGTTAAWTGESNQASARFGVSVAGAGDVNGDGYGDVVVGAYQYDNGEVNEGRAYLYLGSASGLAPSPAWTAEGDQTSAWFGRSVVGAGDVNGDGFGDLLIGASGHDNGQIDEGRAYLFLGSGLGLAASPAASLESDQAGAQFGRSVATAGDINGDGYSDVIVGAHLYDNGQTDEGRAFLHLGSASGLSGSPAWTAEGDQAGAQFGSGVATAGDVNGDGYSDVIVGANLYDNGQTDEGRSSVYLGSASGLNAAPDWTVESNQAAAYFGFSVAGAGDVNGDGYSDVVVGAYLYDNGQTDEGRAFLYFGSASGLLTSPAWTAESNQADAYFGHSVAGAGDVNGDGFGDVIAGAYLYDNGQTDEGRGFVYYGNGGNGLDRAPRQVRADESAPIALLGKSDSDTAFRLKARGRTPAGRGSVRLEWEVKPLGIPFSGSGPGVGSPLDSGPPGVSGSVVELNEQMTGLSSLTRYRWRQRIATGSPFFPRSPWFSLPYNGRTETDLTTAAPCLDTDGDGYGSPGELTCPAGNAGDCNDADFAIHPGAADPCDGIDRDCDAIPDEECDDDGDDFCDSGQSVIGTPAVCPRGGGDCDDSNRFIYPGRLEACDNLDNDCNDGADEGCDDDGDDYCDAGLALIGTPATCSGGGGDCNDADPGINPGAAEVCPGGTGDGIDNNCLYGVDEVCRPLRVVSIDPPDGANDVSVAAVVRATFSKPVDPATVIPSTFIVQSCMQAVAGDLSISEDRHVVTFAPLSALSLSTRYFVALTPGILDATGDPLVPFNPTFLTTADPLAGSFGAGSVGGTVSGSVLEGQEAGSGFGRSAAAVGDVNGDGIGDALIGAPKADLNGIDSGAAYLIFGAAGLEHGGQTGRVTFLGESPEDAAGFTVASAGDINGDGVPDLLIGAPGHDEGLLTGAGRAYVVFGGPVLAPGSVINLSDVGGALPGVVIDGAEAGDQIGFALDGGGDPNGDGRTDLLFGAPFSNPGGRVDAGRAFLVFGPLVSGSINLANVGITVGGAVYVGPAAGDEAGRAVTFWRDSGTTDGDGVDDFVIGSPGADPVVDTVAIDEGGVVYVVLGDPAGLEPGPVNLSRVASGEPDAIVGEQLQGSVAGGRMGTSVSGSDITSTSGIGALAIGAPGSGIGALASGAPGAGTCAAPRKVIAWHACKSKRSSCLNRDRNFSCPHCGTNNRPKPSGPTSPSSDIYGAEIGPCPASMAHDALAPSLAQSPQEAALDFVDAGGQQLGDVAAFVGDIDGKPGEDLAIGVAAESVGDMGGAGKVFVVSGAAIQEGAEHDINTIGLSTPGFVLEGAEENGQLGCAVAGGDVSGDGQADLLTGGPMLDAADPQTPGAILADAGAAFIVSQAPPPEAATGGSQSLVVSPGSNCVLEWIAADRATRYNVYRGLLTTLRRDRRVYTSSTTCLANDTLQDADADGSPDAADADRPSVGEGFFYLVTAENEAGEGSLGTDSGGQPRINDSPCRSLDGSAAPAPSIPGQSDGDGDGLADLCDNCPAVLNAGQTDTDGDDAGDACDPDDDNDGLTDAEEASLGTNPLLVDTDGDGLSDRDEVNVQGTSPIDADTDDDGLGDALEVSRGSNPLLADTDGDGRGDAVDNCPAVPNFEQADTDGDGVGDACEVFIRAFTIGGSGGAMSSQTESVPLCSLGQNGAGFSESAGGEYRVRAGLVGIVVPGS